ncbi:hypothetical protein ABK040_014213 [Willaertia magna]
MSNLNFGSTAPSTGGGFSFGNKPTTTTTTTGGGFNFGTPSTTTGTTGTTATTGGTSTTPAFTTAGTQQQQQIPQQINPKTPFKKLPNQFQRQLEAFEKHKNSTREKVQELVKQQENSNELIKLKQYRKKVEKKINAVGLNTEREKEYIETLKSSVLQETKNVEQAQNNFNKIISPYFNSDLNYTSHYFFNTAQKLEQQMQELWKQIEDISQTLSHSEMYQIASSGTVLQETFTSQQQSFLNVAARLAALHEKVNDLREMYIRVYQVKGDPFKEQPRVTSKQKPARVTFTNINQPQTQQQGFSVPVTTNTTTSAPTTGFNFSTSNTSAPTTTSGTTGTGFNFNTGTTTAPTTTGTTTGTSGFNFGTNTAPTTTGQQQLVEIQVLILVLELLLQQLVDLVLVNLALVRLVAFHLARKTNIILLAKNYILSLQYPKVYNYISLRR